MKKPGAITTTSAVRACSGPMLGPGQRPWSWYEGAGRSVDHTLERVEEMAWRLADRRLADRSLAVGRRTLVMGVLNVSPDSFSDGGRFFEPEVAVARGVAMAHIRGGPATMGELTQYDDLVVEVTRRLEARIDAAVTAGIEPERLAVDPGLGFAKTAAQSLLIVRDIAHLARLGRPVVVGPSRKSFVGLVTQTDGDDRLAGTAGAVGWLAANGANVIRVHDVGAMVRVVRMVDAIKKASG